VVVMAAMRFAVLAVFCLAASGAAAASNGLSCSPPGVDIAHPKPLQLTAIQKTVLIESYSAPEVRGLRTQINEYLAGTAREGTPRTLAGVPHALLRERFLLLADQPGIFGGSYLTIQFEKHPEAIYRVWMYRLSTGAYDVRSWDSAPCSAEQQRYFRVEFGPSLSLAPGG
jgi:hypothetical protein